MACKIGDTVLLRDFDDTEVTAEIIGLFEQFAWVARDGMRHPETFHIGRIVRVFEVTVVRE